MPWEYTQVLVLVSTAMPDTEPVDMRWSVERGEKVEMKQVFVLSVTAASTYL